MNEIILQDYQAARNSFNEMKKKFPTVPLGNIMLAATEISYMTDFATDYHNENVLDLLNDAVSLSEKLLDKAPDNLWNNYYKGLAEGYKAGYHGLNENWFSSLSTGFIAKQYYERCLEIDPDFYEAYIAIGTWKFWSSEKTEFLNWLPLVKDERAEGVRLLVRAIEKKAYHFFPAAHTLTWIYIPQKRFADAKSLLEPIYRLYPESRALMWDLARVYTEIDRQGALRIYNKLLESYGNAPKKNRSNEITLRYQLAKLYHVDGQKQATVEQLKFIPVEASLSALEKKRLGTKLARIRELKAAVGLR